MEPIITEEVIARQPPEARAIIRALLVKIGDLEAEIRRLQGQAKGKTPQNSTLPPSAQHPHARVRLVLDAGNARDAAVRAIQWCDDRQAEIFREPAGDRIQEAEVLEWQMGQQIKVSETGFAGGGEVFETVTLPAPRRRHVRDLV